MERILKLENNEFFVSIGSPVWLQPTQKCTKSGLSVLFQEEVGKVGNDFFEKRRRALADFRKVKFLTPILCALAVIKYLF